MLHLWTWKWKRGRARIFLAHVLSWLTNFQLTYYSNTSKSEPEAFSKSGKTDGLLNMCFYWRWTKRWGQIWTFNETGLLVLRKKGTPEWVAVILFKKCIYFCHTNTTCFLQINYRFIYEKKPPNLPVILLLKAKQHVNTELPRTLPSISCSLLLSMILVV